MAEGGGGLVTRSRDTGWVVAKKLWDGRTVSTRGSDGGSARGVGCSSLRTPLICATVGGIRSWGLSMGVAPPSSSMSESFAAGVAAPLSLDTHSSSSPSDGLAIVKPTFCLLAFGGGAGARRNAGARCSRECTRTLLLFLAIWVELLFNCHSRSLSAHIQMNNIDDLRTSCNR